MAPSPLLPPGLHRGRALAQKDPDNGPRPASTPPQSPEVPILPLCPPARSHDHPRGLTKGTHTRAAGLGNSCRPKARKRPRAATQALQSDSRRDFPRGLPHPQPPAPSSCFLQHKDHTGHTLPAAWPARHLPPPAPTGPVPQCLSLGSQCPGVGWALTVGVRAAGAAAGTPRPAGGP